MGIDGHSALTGRPRRFAEAYLRDPRPKAAAIRAGYSERSAAKTAWRLLHDPAVSAHIRAVQRERADRLRLSIDRIVEEHARLAFVDVGRLVRFTRKGPRIRRRAEIGAEASAAVREIERRGDGFRIRLYDKSRSLDTLTKMLGVVERYQTDGQAVERNREAAAKLQERFMTVVNAIRSRLGIEPGGSPMEALAEGVARGDAFAIEAATKIGALAPRSER